MKCQGWALSLFILFAPAWAAEPVITTIAGGGSGPGIGDGGPATAAVLNGPMSVALDGAGNIYIAEGGEYFEVCRVRKVDRAGAITTFAGNGSRDVTGENVPATSVSVCPRSLAFDAVGNLYIGEHSRIRRVTPAGIISTVVGTGVWGDGGDGGPAKKAQVGIVNDLAFDAVGRLYIISNAGQRIRRVDLDGVIRTVAGNGTYNASGDGGPALSAGMSPRALTVDGAGNIVFADGSNESLRRVSSGVVTRIAGAGPFRIDPLATNSDMYFPRGLAFGRNGEVYAANDSNLVHVVSTAGILKVVVGEYNDSTFDTYGAPWGFKGDNGPATSAWLNRPNDVAVDAEGNLYIADTRNHRIRKVTPVPLPRVPYGLDAFQSVRSYEVGRYTNTLDIGDFNRDGRQDVVVATSSWGSLSPDPETDYRLNVFLQQADGTLAAPQRLAFATSRHVGVVKAVDLNRDGYSDVVLATEAGLNVYLGSAGGLRAGPLLRGVTNAEVPTGFLTGDVDLDGRIDLIAWMAGQSAGGTSPNDQQGITIFYGDGNGGASRTRFLVQQIEGGRLAWADVNRDGRADLLMTWVQYPDDSGVAVFAHDGVDAFRTPSIVRTGLREFAASGIATGDFDGDGLLDVVLSKARNAPAAQLARLRLTAANQLEFVSAWNTYDVPSEIIGQDWDGDGRDDLLVLHAGWSSIGLQQQIPALYTSGLDTEAKYYIRHSGNAVPGSFATGDLNGDGCIDVAVTDYNYGLQVLYSKRCFVTARSSQPLLPPATPSTAGYQMAGSAISTGKTTSVGLRGAIGRWAEGVRHTAARAQAGVRNANTRTIVGGSLFALFLLVVAMRLPLVRRR